MKQIPEILKLVDLQLSSIDIFINVLTQFVLQQNKELYILTMGTKTKSWWLDHGIGCRVNNESWVQDFSEETGRLIPPEEFVEGCILEYYYVEVIHAGIQCLLAVSFFVYTCDSIPSFAIRFSFLQDWKKISSSQISQKFLPDC